MSYFYLATPYSKYPGGLDEAFRLACTVSARLIRAGVPVFSPIAHSHPVALAGGIDPKDHAIWLPADAPFMHAAFGLIVFKADGWRRSYGILRELRAFRAMRKPIRALTPRSIADDAVLDVLRHAAGRSKNDPSSFDSLRASASPREPEITAARIERAVSEAVCSGCGHGQAACDCIPDFLRRPKEQQQTVGTK